MYAQKFCTYIFFCTFAARPEDIDATLGSDVVT